MKTTEAAHQPLATGGLRGTHRSLLINVHCERAANPPYEGNIMLAIDSRSPIAKRSNIGSKGPVDWPREAEEKSDQNEKLSER